MTFEDLESQVTQVWKNMRQVNKLAFLGELWKPVTPQQQEPKTHFDLLQHMPDFIARSAGLNGNNY